MPTTRKKMTKCVKRLWSERCHAWVAARSTARVWTARISWRGIWPELSEPCREWAEAIRAWDDPIHEWAVPIREWAALCHEWAKNLTTTNHAKCRQQHSHHLQHRHHHGHHHHHHHQTQNTISLCLFYFSCLSLSIYISLSLARLLLHKRMKILFWITRIKMTT